MILTCPECATSYFVDEQSIPPQGRIVKCTSCETRWRAMPEPASGEAGPASADAASAAEPPPPPEPPKPTTPEEKAEARTQTRAAAAAARASAAKPARGKPPLVLIGSIAAVAVVGVIGALVLLRQQVAGVLPATAPVYVALGLPVNTLGLVIEGVSSKPTFLGGRPALAVTGAIRNVRDEAREAPALRISLVDEKGETLAGLLAQPLNAKVPPGGTRYFAVSLPDPPRAAHKLEIAFEAEAPSAGKPAAKGTAHHEAPAHAAPHSEAPAHAPEPIEAKPLPPESPDALHPHD